MQCCHFMVERAYYNSMKWPEERGLRAQNMKENTVPLRFRSQVIFFRTDLGDNQFLGGEQSLVTSICSKYLPMGGSQK